MSVYYKNIKVGTVTGGKVKINDQDQSATQSVYTPLSGGTRGQILSTNGTTPEWKNQLLPEAKTKAEYKALSNTAQNNDSKLYILSDEALAAAKINGTAQTKDKVFYAPETAGNYGEVLIPSKNGTPVWSDKLIAKPIEVGVNKNIVNESAFYRIGNLVICQLKYKSTADIAADEAIYTGLPKPKADCCANICCGMVKYTNHTTTGASSSIKINNSGNLYSAGYTWSSGYFGFNTFAYICED